MSSSSESQQAAAGLDELLRYELDPYFRDRARCLLGLLELEPGDRLLDCGCGKGFFVHMVRRLHRCSVTAIDPNREALLRTASGSPGMAALLAQADATRLPFRSATFTKILCSEVLEHVDDDGLVLLELHRLLVPGGLVALSVPNRAYPFCWDPINKTLESIGVPPIRRGRLAGMWTDHRRLYGLDDLCARAARAGFVVEDRRLLTRYCLPFTHNLLYGLGLLLMDHGCLPDGLRRGADRHPADGDTRYPSIPVRALGALTGAIESLNGRRPPVRVSVGMALRLRKPSG